MRRVMSIAALGLVLTGTLSGCAALDEAMCSPNCHSQASSSSSLVSFLYGNSTAPPRQDSIPELHVPLRVGLAFLPPQSGADFSLTAADREALLERIRARFAGKSFVRDITIIPDYYLTNSRGFSGLQGLQRLYNVDLVALVSYDQVTNEDENKLSLGYLTIVGAYVLKGNRHDLTTLMDLAVVDPATRSLVLRAGDTDTRRGDSTLVDQQRDIRDAAVASFAAATDQTIEHFDAALTQLESDVRAGKANVRITSPAGHSGGGALSPAWLFALMGSTLVQVWRRRRDRLSSPAWAFRWMKATKLVSKTFKGAAQAGEKFARIVLDTCEFKDCQFSDALFSKCKFTDCVFVDCNLSNAKVVESKFLNIEFSQCKMIGINWTRATWALVAANPLLTFWKSILNDSSFFGLKLQEMVIRDCRAHGVDFRGTDLTRADLTDTDLQGSLFGKTTLNGADLSGATNYAIDVLDNHVRKARFSRQEALGLLSDFDIDLVD